MDPNTEREISFENTFAAFESMRNKIRMREEMRTKISSTFIERTVLSDDESKTSSKCHSPDSGYSSENIMHPVVIENETNDAEVNEATETSKESTSEPRKEQNSTKKEQLKNKIAAPVECGEFDETEATKENQNPTNVDRKYAIVHSKFNDFKFVKPHTHPTIPQPNPKSKRGKRKTARVPPATKRSKQAANTTIRVSEKSESPK